MDHQKSDEPKEGLAIVPEIRELLCREFSLLAERLPVAGWPRLLEEVSAGRVYPESQALLATGLKLVLADGRIGRLYGAHEEKALRSLFHATDEGRRLAVALEEVNAALQGVAGRRLERLRFTLHNPGSYRLSVQVAGVELQLLVGSDGVRVERVLVG
ncbi:MAG: hypothetical protein Kow00109_06670 [Acidobacteriota bacterium]